MEITADNKKRGGASGTIEIVMRKTEESGKVAETVLASFVCESVVEKPSVLIFPGLEIRIREQEVYRNNIRIPLSHYEFSTLLYLARHPNWVFSKEQIYTAVWKAPGDGGAIVPNVICQIRHKIGEGYIETVVGSGYRFIGK